MLLSADLEKHYIFEKKSAAQIAKLYKCGTNTVHYWLNKYNIPKRSISEAIYVKANPAGDPFLIKEIDKSSDWFLYGLGLGLFWGEGNKVNKNSVRLGNTDPDLINYFLYFLKEIYKIDQEKLRFGLQIFSDIPKEQAVTFWCKKLSVQKRQFQKIIITKSVSKGTYTKKCKYGVLTVYFSNTKLRDIIMGAIEELRKVKPLYENHTTTALETNK